MGASAAAESEPRKQVLQVLKEAREPLGPKEIARRAEKSYGSVRQLLLKMLEDKEVAKPRHGVYTLPTDNGVSSSDNETAPVYESEKLQRLPDAQLEALGYRRVPDVEVDAGPGREPVLEETDGEEVLPGWYIRQEFGVAPERLVRARITGDSMKDTLQPGQRVWAARWEGELLKDGAIYLIYGPHGLQVKRLIFDEKKPEDGGEPVPMIWIWSDNEERPRIRVTRERFEADYQVLAWVLMKNSYL